MRLLIIKHRQKKETQTVDTFNKKLKRKNGQPDTSFGLTNYGKKILYKIEEDEHGEKIIKINREHNAYVKWSASTIGKKLYITMIHALAETVDNLTHKEAAKVLNEFSDAIRAKSSELL